MFRFIRSLLPIACAAGSLVAGVFGYHTFVLPLVGSGIIFAILAKGDEMQEALKEAILEVLKNK